MELTERTGNRELDRLLRAREAAAELAICVRTLHYRVADGTLTPVRIGPRSVRFRSSDIARLQAQGVQQ